MAESDEALVLTDGEGAYWAVPRRVLESYRVTDDAVAAVEAAVGVEEVAGFATNLNSSKSNV